MTPESIELEAKALAKYLNAKHKNGFVADGPRTVY
jgi:hypothetical protein